MSWFSLIKAEQTVLESQNFFQSALTGEFIGQFTVEQVMKKNNSYMLLRGIVSNFFSNSLSKPLESISEEVSENLLNRIVNEKNFPQFFPALLQRIQYASQHLHPKKPASTPLIFEKQLDTCRIYEMVHKLFDRRLKADHTFFNQWSQVIEESEEAIAEFVKISLINYLKPFGKRAIKASFTSLIKTGIENTYDNCWKKGISVFSITTIYRLAMSIFHQTATACENTFLERPLKASQEYFPSPSTLLTLLSGIHVVEMINIFWKVEHLHLKNTDLNKEEVKAFAIAMTKEPISNALKQTELYKDLIHAFTSEKIETFIVALIEEVVDHYWDHLHNMRFLNLPLVT